MTEQFIPTEEQIQSTIDKAGGDIRKVAIAYLRANRRARDVEAAFNVLSDIQNLTLAAATGDLDAAEKAVKSAERHIYQHNDIASTEGN